MTFLILGDDGDEHALHVQSRLRAAGHEAWLLDSLRHPTELSITFEPSSGDGFFRYVNGKTVPFDSIHAVYWRCYNGVAAPRLPDATQDFVAQNDARSLFESLLRALPVRWVNGWDGFQLHQTKAAALARVARLDVAVPATVCTNDPATVRDFAARYDEVVFKPVQGGAHTQPLTPEMLDDHHLQNLKVAPVTLQERIRGTNVRVFVAGQNVFACEIRTDDLDYRDSRRPDLVACELSLIQEAVCRQIAEELHLLWTGIDFIRTEGGRLVFLEANPSPMFLGFEEDADLPLTDALIELLTAE